MRQILLFLVAVASHFVLQAYEHTETLEFSNVQTTNITHNDTSYTKKLLFPVVHGGTEADSALRM